MTIAVLAHSVLGRDEVWTSWAGDPLVAFAVASFAVAYANGALTARERPAMAAVLRRRAAAAAGAVVALVVALVSPLDAAAGALLSAHMVQHVLLSAVAAPLLALAAPVSTVSRALPAPWTRSVRRIGRRVAAASVGRWWAFPATAFALTTLSVWHVPALYDAALRSDAVHGVEHATILGTAVSLWSAVLAAMRRRQVLAATAALALGAVHGSALGALLALSSRPWYGEHAAAAVDWGVDALADQQVAGAVMWVPTAAVHLLALAVLLHGWLRGAERRDAAAATYPARPSSRRSSVRGALSR